MRTELAGLNPCAVLILSRTPPSYSILRYMNIIDRILRLCLQHSNTETIVRTKTTARKYSPLTLL